MEELNKQLQALSAKIGLKGKKEASTMTEMYTDYEINLVPEVKTRMIKAMKFRNLVLFICIIVVAVAGSVVSILGSITGGQSITLSSQDERIEAMSSKLKNWGGLEELLTIQTQLKGIEEANDGKYVLSRIFPVLASVLPTGPDYIGLSELNIDVATSTLTFDAQADALTEPKIDYRVLESFKKGVALMHYDFGRYVDAEGNEIPTRCIVESDEYGNTLTESRKKSGSNEKDNYIYAYWMKGSRDCDPTRDDTELDEEEEEEEEEQSGSGQSSSLKDFMELFGGGSTSSNGQTDEEARQEAERLRAEEFENILSKTDEKYGKETDIEYRKKLLRQQYDDGAATKNIEVVKIYRTPDFSNWYDAGYMDTGGSVNGVEHFESQCIVYSGSESNNQIYWTQTNDCLLAEDGVQITASANGKNSSGSLVLTFSAIIKLDDNVLKFKNKHMMAISPEGRNVTDSYTQIEGMFAERAADCTDADVVCTSSNAKKNSGEE